MPLQISRGFTFTDGGGPYTSANLHTLADSATILPGAITEQADVAPTTVDSFLFYKNAVGLKKCTLQEIIDAFPVDAAAASKALRTLGTGSTQAAPGNDTRFSASVAGLRLSTAGGSTDVAAAPKDLAFTPKALTDASSVNINWQDADLFWMTLPSSAAARTITFSNVADGRVITVIFDATGYTGTITWPTFFGTTPTTTNGSKMIYTFMKTALSANPMGVSKSI